MISGCAIQPEMVFSIIPRMGIFKIFLRGLTVAVRVSGLLLVVGCLFADYYGGTKSTLQTGVSCCGVAGDNNNNYWSYPINHKASVRCTLFIAVGSIVFRFLYIPFRQTHCAAPFRFLPHQELSGSPEGDTIMKKVVVTEYPRR
jgi:hypothetical protein